MATHALAEPAQDSNRLIASPWHTLLMVAVALALAYRGTVRTEHLHGAAIPDRIPMYLKTIFFEVLVLVLALGGVWWRGAPVSTVLGKRWRSLKQVAMDAGIGVAFLMVSIPVAQFVGSLLPEGRGQGAGQFVLPQTQAEYALWLVLAMAAGICEEAVYRGYFQRQFVALTRSVAAGIVLSAAIFAAAHAYLGFWQAVRVGFLGALSSVLAEWRRTVRPGMVAHALQDVLGAFMRH